MCDYSLWVVMGGVLSYSLYIQVLRSDLIFLLSAKFVYAFFFSSGRLLAKECRDYSSYIAVYIAKRNNNGHYPLHYLS